MYLLSQLWNATKHNFLEACFINKQTNCFCVISSSKKNKRSEQKWKLEKGLSSELYQNQEYQKGFRFGETGASRSAEKNFLRIPYLPLSLSSRPTGTPSTTPGFFSGKHKVIEATKYDYTNSHSINLRAFNTDAVGERDRHPVQIRIHFQTWKCPIGDLDRRRRCEYLYSCSRFRWYWFAMILTALNSCWLLLHMVLITEKIMFSSS